MERAALLATLQNLDPLTTPVEKADRAAVSIPSALLLEYMSTLRTLPELNFDLLLAHTAVHWQAAGKFELLYQLYSTTRRHYCLVTCEIPADAAVVASLAGVWRIAEWQEREAYDLFGITYEGHPDLRRVLLDDEWRGFPLRKDYQDDFMLDREP